MTKEQTEAWHKEFHDIAARALVELMRQDHDRVEYERRNGRYLSGGSPKSMAEEAVQHASALMNAVAACEEGTML